MPFAFVRVAYYIVDVLVVYILTEDYWKPVSAIAALTAGILCAKVLNPGCRVSCYFEPTTEAYVSGDKRTVH